MHQNQLVKLYNRAPQSTGQAVQQGIRINRSSCTAGHQNQPVKLYNRASESTSQAVQQSIRVNRSSCPARHQNQPVKLYNRASESTGQAVQEGIRIKRSSCTTGHQNREAITQPGGCQRVAVPYLVSGRSLEASGSWFPWGALPAETWGK